MMADGKNIRSPFLAFDVKAVRKMLPSHLNYMAVSDNAQSHSLPAACLPLRLGAPGKCSCSMLPNWGLKVTPRHRIYSNKA